MNIKENFTTLDRFKRGAAIRRNCFKRCGFCRLEWSKLNTINVHYAVFIEDKKQKEMFFCDECLKNKK